MASSTSSCISPHRSTVRLTSSIFGPAASCENCLRMALRAGESGIQKLYHYERFEPKYLEDTLVNRRIHFSNPKHFNDPWDCYPSFDTTRLTDPIYRASCIGYLRQFPFANLSAAQRLSYETRLQADGRLFTEMLQTEFRESIRNTIVERWRIYCLTPHSDHPLMWSHYSNHHKGICIEFEAGQSLVGSALQVAYCDKLPALDILRMSGEAVFRIFVMKSPDWFYEKEYRILARDSSASDAPASFLPVTNNDFLSMPPGVLTAIIAGCRADVDMIKALVEKYAPGLPVKRAVQAPDRYSLSIQEPN